MKEVNKIPCIFYYYLHSKIWDSIRGDQISEKDLKTYLFQWKIPNKIKPLIIKELIKLGLLEKDKKYWLIVKRSNFDDGTINKYYQDFNIY